NHGQCYACVSAGGLDQGIAGRDLATGLSAAYHGIGGAILDGAGGIITFQFCQDPVAAGVTELARNPLQAHQWSAADAVFDSRISFHDKNHNPPATKYADLP